MFLLVALLFGILYGVITGIGTWMGAGSAATYIIMAFAFLGIQYLISPYIVGRNEDKMGIGERGAGTTPNGI
jgi:heat shock protein HtpX